MSAMTGQFRGAVFGGFHRQDVLDYLEKLKEEHRQALEEQKAEQEASFALTLSQRDEEITELKRQIAALLPQAEAWQKIRDTAGDITVTAHAQAQSTIQDADRHAAQTRAESVRRVREVQERCTALREALHQSVLLAEGELDAAKASFRRAEEDLAGMENALTHLVGSVKECPMREETETPQPEQPPCPQKTRPQAGEWVD